MQITTADTKTLAEMLGNTLRPGWALQLTVADPGAGAEEAMSTLEVDFVRMDGNGLRVMDSNPDAESKPATVDLADVEALHIY